MAKPRSDDWNADTEIDDGVSEGAASAYFTTMSRRRKDAERIASFAYHGLDGSPHHAIMKGEPIDRGAFLSSVRDFAASALDMNSNRST